MHKVTEILEGLDITHDSLRNFQRKEKDACIAAARLLERAHIAANAPNDKGKQWVDFVNDLFLMCKDGK